MTHFMGTRNVCTHTNADRQTHSDGSVGNTISQTFLNQIFVSFNFASAVNQEQKVFRVTISTFLTFPLPLQPLLNNLERLGASLTCN